MAPASWTDVLDWLWDWRVDLTCWTEVLDWRVDLTCWIGCETGVLI